MANERVTLRFNGLLTNGATTAAQRASWVRVAKTVRLSVNSAPTSEVQVKLRLAGSAQDQVYSLGAGLLLAETAVSGAGLSIPANTNLDAIIVANGGAENLEVHIETESAAVALGADVDCHLGMLSTVKAHILAAGLQSGTDYNAALTRLARGIAARFNKHTNRLLVYSASAQDIFAGNAHSVVLRRYPVVSVTSVELTDNGSTWTTQTGAIVNQRLDNGWLYFGGSLGAWSGQIRVNYAGGYWYDSSTDQSGSLPTGATELPADITLAWLLAIEHVWRAIDRLGTGLVTAPDASAAVDSRLAKLQLPPEVASILDGYRRIVIA